MPKSCNCKSGAAAQMPRGNGATASASNVHASKAAIRRRFSPEDNNERQQIHDHESVALMDGAQ